MKRPTCTARDGLIYDLAGTPYTIEEAKMRAHIVLDLAIDHPGEAYTARLTDLIDAIHQASVQSATRPLSYFDVAVEIVSDRRIAA